MNIENPCEIRACLVLCVEKNVWISEIVESCWFRGCKFASNTSKMACKSEEVDFLTPWTTRSCQMTDGILLLELRSPLFFGTKIWCETGRISRCLLGIEGTSFEVWDLGMTFEKFRSWWKWMLNWHCMLRKRWFMMFSAHNHHRWNASHVVQLWLMETSWTRWVELSNWRLVTEYLVTMVPCPWAVIQQHKSYQQLWVGVLTTLFYCICRKSSNKTPTLQKAWKDQHIRSIAVRWERSSVQSECSLFWKTCECFWGQDPSWSQQWVHHQWSNMGVSKNRGTPKWMVYNGNPIKMDDFEVPLFLETPI